MSGSVWTFALQTQPRPKLLERIETGLGEVRLLGRLRSLSKAETAFVNERGAQNVTIWKPETSASITGKADAKFYTCKQHDSIRLHLGDPGSVDPSGVIPAIRIVFTGDVLDNTEGVFVGDDPTNVGDAWIPLYGG